MLPEPLVHLLSPPAAAVTSSTKPIKTMSIPFGPPSLRYHSDKFSTPEEGKDMVFFKLIPAGCWKQVLLALVTSLLVEVVRSQGSYYSSFSGPVSGAVDEISVPEAVAGFGSSDQNTFDFVARPDYTFGYGVNDPATGNAQKHEETRDGDTVRGQYSVLEPDGTLRTVVYTADPENGFQATVHRKPSDSLTQQFALGNPLTDVAGPQADFPPADYSPPDYNPSPDYTPAADYNPEY